MRRIVIVGNSGSGKSTLADELGRRLGCPVVNLDDLFWEPGGFERKRPKETVLEAVRELAQGNGWIVEGVFGELAQEFLPRATALIWLDLDWATCLEALKKRGVSKGDPEQTAAAEASFQRLLAWAEQYWQRDDLRSHRGHQRLYEAFEAQKFHLERRDEFAQAIEWLTGAHPRDKIL